MTDLFDSELSPDQRHHIVRRHSRSFINQQDAVR